MILCNRSLVSTAVFGICIQSSSSATDRHIVPSHLTVPLTHHIVSGHLTMTLFYHIMPCHLMYLSRRINSVTGYISFIFQYPFGRQMDYIVLPSPFNRYCRRIMRLLPFITPGSFIRFVMKFAIISDDFTFFTDTYPFSNTFVCHGSEYRSAYSVANSHRSAM